LQDPSELDQSSVTDHTKDLSEMSLICNSDK